MIAVLVIAVAFYGVFKFLQRLDPDVLRIETVDELDGHDAFLECCEERMTWTLKWEESGSSMIITDAEEAVMVIENEILCDLFESETVTITVAPHKMMTEHEIEALPEFEGW